MSKNAINTKFIIDVDQGPYYIDTLSTILLHSLLILLYTFEKFSTLFLNDCNLTVPYYTVYYCIIMPRHESVLYDLHYFIKVGGQIEVDGVLKRTVTVKCQLESCTVSW